MQQARRLPAGTRLGMLVGKPRFGGGGGYAQSQRITSAMRDQGRFVDDELRVPAGLPAALRRAWND